jgi:hypothetical protein
MTPAPEASAAGRADALTVRAVGTSGTLTNAVSVSQSVETKPEPLRAARWRRSRGLFVALGAASAVIVAVAVVVAAAGDKGSKAPGAVPPPPATPAPSAIAIVTEPAGPRSWSMAWRVARGAAPVNVAARVGADIEIRAELFGYAPAVQRAKVAAEPATVRVVLAAMPTASAPVDAGTDTPPAVVDAGGRQKRPRGTPAGPAVDPDGLVQP